MSQQALQRHDAIPTKRFAVVRSLPLLKSLSNPIAQSMPQLAGTAEDRCRAISSKVARRRARIWKDHSMGGMDKTVRPFWRVFQALKDFMLCAPCLCHRVL